MAASLSPLSSNRLGGALPSGGGGVSWLTRTLNCRSRSARLRGALGGADTSRLAVASEVPAQALAGLPPVVAVRKPVGLSSKLALCATTGAAISTKSTAAAAAKLAREAFIGDGDLELPHRRTGLDYGKRHQAGDQEADDNNSDHTPQLRGGHAEEIPGTKQGHDAGNLPRLAPKRQSRTILIVFGEPPRLKRWPEWATSMASSHHGRPFTPIAAAHRRPRAPDGRGQERHRQAAGDAACPAVRRRRWRDSARRRV